MNDMRIFPRTWRQERDEIRDREGRMRWPTCISLEFLKDRRQCDGGEYLKIIMVENFSELVKQDSSCSLERTMIP